MTRCLFLASLVWGNPNEPERPSAPRFLILSNLEAMIQVPLKDDVDGRHGWFLACSPFALPRLGVAHDRSLGDTPFGAFAASFDVEASPWGLGTPFRLWWFPCEALEISVGFDPLRGRMFWDISGDPLVRRPLDEFFRMGR